MLPPERVTVRFSSLFIWDGTFHRQVLWAKLHLGHTVTVTFLGDFRKAKRDKQPKLSACLAFGIQLPKALLGLEIFIAFPFLLGFV